MTQKDNNYDNKGYEIEYKQDGVYLTMLPLTQVGMFISVPDILNYLNSKQVKDYDEQMIEVAIKAGVGSSNKIAEAQEEYKINALVDVTIRDDLNKAYIYIIPPDGGRMLTTEEIIAALNEKSIIFGINEEKINDLSKNPIFNQDILIAEGVEPTHGENGRMQYHFQISKNRTPKILEDGRVDFHELDLIENVHAGDVLITAVPPTSGEPGKNVYGNEVKPAPGKPVTFPKGKNVEITEDEVSLVASIDGQVVLADKKVHVYGLYEVPGDVDSSTGDIKFIGNVVVKGNVLTGFTIESGGTVEVQGVVEGATIKATGDIVLRRGMQGADRGVLVTDGNIVAKYIEHSNIKAKGDIKSEAIMHSSVVCGGDLELTGKKGLFVGGVAKIGKDISAKVIGSPMATATEIEVGTDPSIRERYKELHGKIENVEDEIKKATQAIELLRKLEKVNQLDERKQELLEKSLNTKEYLREQIQEMKQEYKILEERLEQQGKGKINVSDMIYPGTKVAIGSSLMYVKERIQRATLYREYVDIKVGTFQK